jgi:hypothetical protein
MAVLPSLTDSYRHQPSNLFLLEEELSLVVRECEEDWCHLKKCSHSTGDNFTTQPPKRRHH